MTAQTASPAPPTAPQTTASGRLDDASGPADAASAAGPADRPTGPSLSPSRAADFKTCPLLFRFRTIDRLPEQPSADQVRGTLVHAVLERLFDLPAAQRTPAAAAALVSPEWQRLVAQEPVLADLFTPTGSPLPEADLLADFLAGAGALLDGYFAVEDPQRLEPAERESLISTLVDDELLIRGYIDRLDVSPAGDLRVVDYKTGGAPREAFEGRALFQLKFYALVLWRTRGLVPKVLRLLYLKDAEVCDYRPDAEELERFERTLVALSQAIERAKRDRDFRPKPSKLCGWCRHQQLCPEFGGTPPPYPEPDATETASPADAANPTDAASPADAARAAAGSGAGVATGTGSRG
ncbi:RecB family exonuclease [Krasilnikovia sp. M28-CT-15]|uniref:RecB family exonuclease n=1 Tax=Krasilnikovia sp. M28-CT-15 TaxID=3373540 RepID=UPI003876E8B2